jgi:hypothetical protein
LTNTPRSQKRRFIDAAREHDAEDGPDLDEVMRRLAAQKRREENPPTRKAQSKKRDK